MSRDNDFSPKTKTRLAERAGYKCCYLGCGQATMGPSREGDNSKKNNTGVAAHIFSASFGSGARRLPPKGMTSEEIKSLNNGIWMCQTHGKYIDADEKTFTAKQLAKWREIGEEVARKMQEFRRNYLEVLSELEHYDPQISKMISFAQEKDPSTNKYHTVDLLLYRKIMKMIPESVRWVARQGTYVYTHPDSVRKPIGYYYDYLENNTVDFSFFNENLQRQKIIFDTILRKLVMALNANTFPILDRGDEVLYEMSQDWRKTPEGFRQYEKASFEIQSLSQEFIRAFDNLHKICRNAFAE